MCHVWSYVTVRIKELTIRYKQELTIELVKTVHLSQKNHLQCKKS